MTFVFPQLIHHYVWYVLESYGFVFIQLISLNKKHLNDVSLNDGSTVNIISRTEISSEDTAEGISSQINYGAQLNTPPVNKHL